MRPSDKLATELRSRGFTVVRAPQTEPYWRNAGWRSAGTCCWSATVEKDGRAAPVLCWWTMREALANQDKWSITWNNRHGQWELDLITSKEATRAGDHDSS